MNYHRISRQAVICISVIQILLLSRFAPSIAAVQLDSAPESRSWTASKSRANQAFVAWTQSHRSGNQVSASSAEALATGVELARARSVEMRSLLEHNPAEFVRYALPDSERSALPTLLHPFIERHVKLRGTFAVYCGGVPGTAMAGLGRSQAGYGYEVRLEDTTYRAFAFGKWRDQQSVREARIEGVILGDAIAIGDGLTPDEQAANGEPVIAETPTTSGPNMLLYVIARFSDQSSDPVSDATALSHMAGVSNFWFNNSSGTVWLRGLVNQSQVMDIVHIVLPIPSTSASTYQNSFGLLLSDARNAANAQGFNYANYNLDLVVTTGGGFSYAGRAYIGGQGAHCVAGYTSLRTAGHELGHNIGLFHADYWRTDGTKPFGRDSVPGGYVADSSNAEWVEYGHYFSVMSAQFGETDDPTKPHYAPVEKARLGWLSGNELQYVTTSGTYRLYRHDAGPTVGTPRAIRIESPATDYTGYARRYWLGYRYAPWFGGMDWLRNGLQVDVCQSSYGSDGAIQLDMTPFSNDTPSGASYTSDNTDKLDGALIVGRTYSDTTVGVHITPTATGNFGVNEEYIDVVINLGTFPGNRPPVITAFTWSTNQVASGQPVNFGVNAADPDGDVLAYSWDFDEVQTWTQSGLNSPNATKSWPAAGQYRVTVTVSDRIGGVATKSTIAAVGAPAANRQVWGRVLWGGTPVYGARVSTSAGSTTFQAWTDSDGTYVLTDLTASDSYLLKCQRDGLTFTSQFANPVSLPDADAFGLDFYANESLPGGGGANTFVLSGQVTYGGAGVSGAEARAGGKVVITDASGNYLFTNLPAGNYTVTPRKDAWTFSPANRVVTLSSANSTGNNFSRIAPHTISGRIDGPSTAGNSTAPTVWLSNGQAVEATKQGSGGNRYWGYTLTGVPGGQFSVSAELSGWLIQPSGFSNPVLVNSILSAIDFSGSATSSTYGYAAGRLTEQGLPLAGASVAARVGGVTVLTTTSDADGYFLLANLTNGAYTIVPSLTGYAFSPASSTTSFVPASGHNFAGSSAATPPSINSITASPTTVSNVNLTATLSVAATGFAPLSYSWDAVSSPAPVAFSVNDSPSAASTVVSFQSPGNHTFRARVVDGRGFVTTANVSLTVNAGAGAMVVSPYEVRISEGQSVLFSADAWDQLGNPTSVAPDWNVTGGGSIYASGLFNATTAGGPYQVIATAGSLSGTSSVWVTAANLSPPSILVEPQSQAVAAGSNFNFSVSVSGTALFSYQWQRSGTNLPGATSSSYGKSAALSTDAGDYRVIVTNLAGIAISAPATLTVNSFPNLQPIADQVIHAGGALVLTNVASDLDAPPQLLTFSLAAGAPAGAAVDSTTGVFTWNSAFGDSGSSHPVTVLVTDNGTPSLSDSRSFAIQVVGALVITSAGISNSLMTINWSAIPGHNYEVQTKDDLTGSPWQPQFPNVLATDATAYFSEPLTNTQRLYRVTQLP